MYADFECLTMKYSPKMSKPIDANTYYTENYQHHKPCGYKINVLNSITNETDSSLYRGSDCMNHFVKTCRTMRLQIMNKLQINVPIIMTREDEYDLNNATHCSVCENPCDPDDKVRDHCHMTGKYRGSAHSSCNLHVNFKDLEIPVFVHNLKGYDSHISICNAHECQSKIKIDAIAQNSEQFIKFGFDNLQFKYSCSLLSSSLDILVGLNKYKDYDDVRSGNVAWTDREYLDNRVDNFKHSITAYVKDGVDLDILTYKGVYPHDYMNTWDKFNEPELPSKEHFYSKLYDEHISDDDYDRAKLAWDRFNLNDVGEYHDL